MIIIMSATATKAQITKVITKLKQLKLKIHPSLGEEQAVIGVLSDTHFIPTDQILAMPGVERITRVTKPYKLASRAFKHGDTVIKVNNVTIGDGTVTIMAGPCAVENREQILKTAASVKKAGCHILRGGAFKPRTAPYEFQGLGEEGLKLLREAGDKTKLPVITEVLDPRDVPMVEKYGDILQIGTRNMQNFSLLRACGESKKPVLLKRGMAATYTEFLLAAEYIMAGGNHKVILCERGIRTFVTETRNTLDINAIPYLAELTHLPIIVDPSHATGKKSLVRPIARAGIAAGAHGLLIEAHIDADNALTDAAQTIDAGKELALLVKEVEAIAKVLRRKL